VAGPTGGLVDGALADLVQARLRDVPDYPVPGVVFKDITPLLADHDAFRAVVQGMADVVAGPVDAIAGVEARGFILGAPIALHRDAGFVPVRKVGKLPGDTIGISYDLEYGTAEIEVHADAFSPGDRVVVVDDVLATGGTAAAACELIERAGAEVVAVVFLLELSFLGGRSKLTDRTVHTILTV
jgi:adenine phosphoribosyltransferase